MALTVTSARLQQDANIRLEKTFRTGWRTSSAGITRIYTDLVQLEQGTYPKYLVEDRWDFMLLLAAKVHDYLDEKRRIGKDLNKVKYLTLQELETSLLLQVAKERGKAKTYGIKVHAHDKSGGIILGKNNPHHGAVRFELALQGALPKRKVVNGQTLWEVAQSEGVKLTGNDNRDAYILRTWLKQMAAQNRLQELYLNPIEYANTKQRKRYELTFTSKLVNQSGNAFNTIGGGVTGEQDAGMFVIALDGTWYAKSGQFYTSANGMHHSSFLSGEPVLLAGTLRVANGKLQYFSNSSGHYSPKIADVVNGAKTLPDTGLDQAARHDVSVLAMDFEGKYGGANGAKYLFPYAAFSRLKGNIPNPQNYLVNAYFDKLYWANPNADRPNHHAKAGGDVKGTTGKFVVFP